MLFMYIHTHSPEKCVIDKPEQTAKMFADAQATAQKAGFKIVASYTAPHQHTMFVVIDANDIVALEKALVPMTLWGDAELIPVAPMEAFRPPQK